MLQKLFKYGMLLLVAFMFVMAFTAPAFASDPGSASTLVTMGPYILAVGAGGLLYLICRKDDPDKRKKISDFFDRNRDR